MISPGTVRPRLKTTVVHRKKDGSRRGVVCVSVNVSGTSTGTVDETSGLMVLTTAQCISMKGFRGPYIKGVTF